MSHRTTILVGFRGFQNEGLQWVPYYKDLKKGDGLYNSLPNQPDVFHCMRTRQRPFSAAKPQVSPSQDSIK